ncbi:MAG: phosphate acyltransferase PlsX [Candidatus Omnitrophota bacterium]|nr:phosphate acyltransferase PlsX [Candidatus Omnitrophota bacterium]
MRIALDAMGGDNAPQAEVEGAVLAAREDKDLKVVLVGIQDQIEKELRKYRPLPEGISVVHASEVIEMHEPAANSVRKKRDSSIVRGIELIKESQADAFVSAGNTGAAVCAATLFLRLLPGIERPGIAIVIPTLKGAALMLDVGANIDPKPNHLLQYAIMASDYSHYVLGTINPSVGLLNIGEEESKGTEFMKETHKLLSERILNFVGNVEGKDIFAGNCDCIICDGFVGNVVLKVSESLVETVIEFLRREIKKNWLAKFGVVFMQTAFAGLKKQIDYAEYGGAPLLGVDGVVIICHGRSNAKAIKNALKAAKKEVELDVNKQIIEKVKAI